ncbi:glycoside hydrolase family 95 protein [Bacteroides fragilis]|uniref:glycoside hydrolase family 95 protein n=1 Tax=Bacteroides fragilis TaxID=817 RepID=UPI002030D43B|nr:glycoside hydrolase family 95 protein [Bacteroides fragilis]MCM0296160.1 glycoside hydrolase N-terminal domain-containing protein [Bacteroides fragilis]MCM0315654.1 glycoside hydrolase N-terminal domain-containing protein [Bacteroides fragilis]
MKKLYSLLFTALFALPAAHVHATDYTQGLSIWFDTPNTLQGRAIWYGSRPDLWKGESKPESAGDTARNPDANWESQSLPIGNGSIGANIMGSIEAERITFNEKTLWRGGPNTSKGAEAYWNVNKQSAHVLDEIRQAFSEGDQKKAAMLTRKNFNSEVPYESNREKPFRFGNFTTMGEFYVETGLSAVNMSGYKRILSLDSALAVVQFKKDDVAYERSYFISYPANVMAIRFKADRPGKQNLTFSYAPNPVSTGSMTTDGNNGLTYTAHLDNNGMQYVVRIHATTKGGTLSNADGKITVKDADEVVFLVTADTDYKINFDPDFKDPKTYVGVNPVETTRQWMDNAVSMGYDVLFKQHYDDYATLFNRVKLQLNPDQQSANLPTAKRLQNYRKGQPDFYLEELYYQFGRYLLIASSRPGNMPANLQGIWHNNVDGPWRVDYHNNINIQMNYWPACPTNLNECTLPLVDFIRTLVKPGQKTAQAYFGTRGWTASISANIFGFTAPLESEDMSWNFNPMAGPWLATHIWEYYDYTRDKKFLKETGYDLIKSSAQFATDFLWRKPDGTYTAAPSTSPEHGPIDEGTTFVHAVIREILLDAIEASKVLGVDSKERKQWQEVLAHLAPYKVGRYGQLMEWSKDIDDPKDEHRHVNHLFGLHPGHTLSPITTPDLAKAARVVLEHRGDGATGWSMGWKLNQWARLQDGNHAYKLFGNLLKNGTLDNLWDTHPPFQIDGNFGGTAGITEMLLQSHMGFIQLLPALPDAWKDGSISGICAKGNFEVDMSWKNGQLAEATVFSKAGEPCTVRYGDKTLSFKTSKGKVYKLAVEADRLIVK